MPSYNPHSIVWYTAYVMLECARLGVISSFVSEQLFLAVLGRARNLDACRVGYSMVWYGMVWYGMIIRLKITIKPNPMPKVQRGNKDNIVTIHNHKQQLRSYVRTGEYD